MQSPTITKLSQNTYKLVYTNKEDSDDLKNIGIFIHDGVGHRITNLIQYKVEANTYTHIVEAK